MTARDHRGEIPTIVYIGICELSSLGGEELLLERVTMSSDLVLKGYLDSK
jgi:hypothetical protein